MGLYIYIGQLSYSYQKTTSLRTVRTNKARLYKINVNGPEQAMEANKLGGGGLAKP